MAEEKKMKRCPVSLQPDIESLLTDLSADLLTRPRVGKISRAHACTVWARLCSASSCRLPLETPAFREELDALKFLCRDLWAAMFQKHMDGLRTNHQVGVRAQLRHLASSLGALEPPQGPTGDVGGKNPRLTLAPTLLLGAPKGGQDCSGWQGCFFNFSLPLRSDPCTVS